MPSPRRHLTLDVLRRHLADRALAPSDRGLVGVEIELLTFPSADPRRRPPAAELRAIASDLRLPAGSRITLEPGGQVELSTPPLRGLASALPAAAADLAALTGALRGAGLAPVARGLDTLRSPERILDQPRYAAMEAFFDGEGFAGRTMMCSTASVQVNVETGPAGRSPPPAPPPRRRSPRGGRSPPPPPPATRGRGGCRSSAAPASPGAAPVGTAS